MMQKTVVMMATLDTKGSDCDYVRRKLWEKGVNAIVVDTSLQGNPSGITLLSSDISAEKFFELGGINLTAIRKLAADDKNQAIEIASTCAKTVALKLFANDQLHGIISLGGSAGTAIGTSAMGVLPFCVPKLMVSTLASGDTSKYVGIRDITMMHSVTDISGARNRISNRILSNAAVAIAAMANDQPPLYNLTHLIRQRRPLIGLTMFGVTTPCVQAVQKRLEASQYECITFHAVASGRRALEAMINDGYINGVCDVTTVNLSNNIGNGIHSVTECLEAAVEKDLPQVISVGALDMINFNEYDSLPDKLKPPARKVHKHNSHVTLVRTTPAESEEIGKIMAEKLNKSKGTCPIILIFPLKGISDYDKEGGVFDNADARIALLESLRAHLNPDKVKLVEVNCHINDTLFAERLADEMIKIMQNYRKSPRLSPASNSPNLSCKGDILDLPASSVNIAEHSAFFTSEKISANFTPSPISSTQNFSSREHEMVRRTSSSPVPHFPVTYSGSV